MTERSWYYVFQNQQRGPVPENGLKSLLARGDLLPDAKVWTSGMQNWMPASSIDALFFHEPDRGLKDDDPWNVPADEPAGMDATREALPERENSMIKERPPAMDEETFRSSWEKMPVENVRKAVQEIHTYNDTAARIILEEAKKRGIYSEPPSADPITPAVAAAPGSAAVSHNKLRANKSLVQNSVCAACSNQFQLAEEIVQCLGCNTYYHAKCFSDSGGCRKPSCAPPEVKVEAPAPDNAHCPHCGQIIKAGAMKCKNCGKLLDKEMKRQQIIAAKGNAPGAVGALVVGIVGLLFLGFILGWVAISNGRSALKKIDEDPGYTGRGLAIAGIVMGCVDIAGWLIAILTRMG